MKHIIFFLFISTTVFAQTPRLKFRQIQKDTTQGSIAISNPADSQLVFSRDFYISYGVDTVLILYGDTLAATSGIISSVLSDNVTITGDGSVGNPLKVDTATVISTIKGLVDTLTARGYLTANQTITLSGDVTGSGTTAITATVVDDSHNHIISNVDFLQDSLTAKANASELTNYLLTSNYIVDSTRINATGDTAFYYQNGVEIGSQSIAGGGGTSYNNISETADTLYVAKYLDVDTSTLYVDATNNRVGIGTSSPSNELAIQGDYGKILNGTRATNNGTATSWLTGESGGLFVSDNLGAYFGFDVYGTKTTPTDIFNGNDYARIGMWINDLIVGGQTIFKGGALSFVNQKKNADGYYYYNFGSTYSDFEDLRVGVATTSPSYTLDVNGDINASGEVRNSGVILISDARYKKDITPLYNANEKLMQFNPVSYYWNELMLDKMSNSQSKNKESIKYGLVAQEVEAIMPEFVSEGQDGYKAIDYQAIITLLIKSNQEQQSEIEQLKTLITDLTNRIQILENK